MRPSSSSTRVSTAKAHAQTQLTGPAAWIDNHLASEHGRVTGERRLGGSSWASFGSVDTSSGARFFVKTSGSDAASAEMFRGEMLGLNALRDASDASGAGLAVPRVFYGGAAPEGATDSNSSAAFIVMEWLDLGGGGGSSGGKSLQFLLGEALARMHNAPSPCPEKGFGFSVDNTIGGTPQPNAWSSSWVEFFRERRLRFQLKLAGDASLTAAAAPVLDNLELLFNDYAPGGAREREGLRPSVLHGDLWSGNYGASNDGSPAIFDPAVYYGHSEAEFGMSWCAGFSSEFWGAYKALRPPAPGFEARRDLYKLYHYLNHLNLFGGGYRGECARCIDRLAAVVKAGGVRAR
jgi:fructosamine-3-kinase